MLEETAPVKPVSKISLELVESNVHSNPWWKQPGCHVYHVTWSPDALAYFVSLTVDFNRLGILLPDTE